MMPDSGHRVTPQDVRRKVKALRERRMARRSRGLRAVLNLPAMIDMTFLFLIFFLVTTTFERAEGILASEMPKLDSRPAVALPVTPIVLRLTPAPDDLDGFVIRIDRFDNMPATFDELVDFLRSVHKEPGFDQHTPVVIVAGDEVRWDHVVGAWNAALRADCKRIAFAEP
jgi:biopolymer transport protein ExbD